ncbi:MAG: MFS transporter, partial [Chitinophagales bacterium]|nr:MFS transporter [Chitinophagales bacterium]
MKFIIRSYRNVYGGLSTESWLLAFITFINRSGMMVLPFLNLYLTESLHFSVTRAGIVLSLFGVGSMIGSFLGGWLTDRIGYFKVSLFSLVVGGVSFILLSQVRSFEALCICMLLSSIIVESLRPALSSSVAIFSKPENFTRSFSLLRMAINLGASFGPAIGGLLAAASYTWLFIGDGATSIAAGIFFYFYFRSRSAHIVIKKDDNNADNKTPYTDIPFLVFILFCCLYAILFFQIFTTLPLYYRNVHHLSEPNIGLLLALNGIIVVFFEMAFVYTFEKKFPLPNIIITGVLLSGIAMIVLNFIKADWILYVSMILLSFSEILAMPFMMT